MGKRLGILPRLTTAAILGFILISCGTEGPPDWLYDENVDTRTSHHDPALQLLIQEFQAEADVRGVDLPLLGRLESYSFGQTRDSNNPSRIGMCTITRINGRVRTTRIIIDEAYRESAQSMRVKGIMFHELGHCVLLKDHVEGKPPMIMSPAIARSSYLKENWTKLLDNFFLGTTL